MKRETALKILRNEISVYNALTAIYKDRTSKRGASYKDTSEALLMAQDALMNEPKLEQRIRALEQEIKERLKTQNDS